METKKQRSREQGWAGCAVGSPALSYAEAPLCACREAVGAGHVFLLQVPPVSFSEHCSVLSVDFCALLIMQTPLVSLCKWCIKILTMRRAAVMWTDSWFPGL